VARLAHALGNPFKPTPALGWALAILASAKRRLPALRWKKTA
jgi:hypothetical protein